VCRVAADPTGRESRDRLSVDRRNNLFFHVNVGGIRVLWNDGWIDSIARAK
jgi:hypothetical protein